MGNVEGSWWILNVLPFDSAASRTLFPTPLHEGVVSHLPPIQASLKPRDSSVFVQEHYAVIGIGNCLWCFCLPPNCRSGVEIPKMISIKWSSRFVVVFYIFSQSTIASPPLWVWSNLRTMYIICHGLQRSHPRCVIGSSVSKVPCPLLPQNYHSSHIIENWIKFWVGKCVLQTLKTVISHPTLKWDKR